MPDTMTVPAVPTVDEIKSLLLTNARAREKALLVLLDRQTADEQASERTIEHNGRGFTGYDAELLTSFAKQVRLNRYGNPPGQRLSPRQHEIAIKRLPKYAKQLRLVATEKAVRGTVDQEAVVVGLEVAAAAPVFVAPAPATLFSACPDCGGNLTVDTNVGGECVEVPCPRCCGATGRA